MFSIEKNLRLWDGAIELASMIYELTRDFPAEEISGFTAQTRRCAIVVVSSIAEREHRTSKNYASRLWNLAHSAVIELETHLIIADRLKFVKNNALFIDCMRGIGEMKKLIERL